jgi:endogenous inhibitor of DNA gyrase (YacG/DUF329 family)
MVDLGMWLDESYNIASTHTPLEGESDIEVSDDFFIVSKDLEDSNES